MRDTTLRLVSRRLRRLGFGGAAVLGAALLVSGSAWGHVAFNGLDVTNNTLVAGSMVELRWIDTITHDTTGYHLSFVPSQGADRVPIADVAATVHSYVWQVPETPCSDCALTVIQDNTGTDYAATVSIQIAPQGTSDAGAADAGTNDAGAADAGTNDAGAADAGTNDAGAADAGATETGPGDAGSPESADSGGVEAAPSASASRTPGPGSAANSGAGCALGSGGGAPAGGWSLLLAVLCAGVVGRRRYVCREKEGAHGPAAFRDANSVRRRSA